MSRCSVEVGLESDGVGAGEESEGSSSGIDEEWPCAAKGSMSSDDVELFSRER